jgi:[ribosomal protein S18]-alanine N-acetyltransferase
MGDIKIVTMGENHIDSVIAISTLSFPTTWSRTSFKEELFGNQFARYVVAEIEDHVVGFGGVWLIIDEGHITNIAVHPEFRGVGVGETILKALIDLCRLEFIPSMTLEVRKSNTAARKLYEKFGFMDEGVRKRYYQDNDEDAIIMWKRGI